MQCINQIWIKLNEHKDEYLIRYNGIKEVYDDENCLVYRDENF